MKSGNQRKIWNSNKNGGITNEALLFNAPCTLHGADVYVEVGDKPQVSIGAVGPGTLKYQWQYHYDGATTWKNWGTGNPFNPSAAAKNAWNNMKFRCIVTDGDGNSVTSQEATLYTTTLSTGPVITTQPADAYALVGEKVSVSIAAKGTAPLTYKWEFCYVGGSWKSWGSGNPFTPSAAAKDSWDGLSFRCIVMEDRGETVTSGTAILHIGSDPSEATTFKVGDVEYEKINDTTARVKKYSGSAASVTINETVNGFTIVEVGESAFENRTALVESIDLPDTVQVIGKRAFAGCTKLSTMN